jgi:hypothetical protein
MNPLVMRVLLALYPRDWRDRYGAEVARLTDELIAKGETTPLRGALDLLASAVTEWGRALADPRRTALATAVAALIAMAGGYLIIAHPWSTRTPAMPTSTASATRLSCVSDLAVGYSVTLVIAKTAGSSRTGSADWTVEVRMPDGAIAPVTVGPGPCLTVPMFCQLATGQSSNANALVAVKPDKYAAIRCAVPPGLSAPGTAIGVSGSPGPPPPAPPT